MTRALARAATFAVVGVAVALSIAAAAPGVASAVQGASPGDERETRALMDPISRAALFPHRREVRDAEYERLQPLTVRFPNAQGAALRGLWYESGDSDRTILVCMGNTGNATWMAPYAAILVDGGFDVLLFDYQGFGASEGVASLLSLPGDVLAAWRFVTDEMGREPAQVGVLGISLGSVLALSLVAEQQPRACAVEDVFFPDRELESFASGASTGEQLALAGMKALILSKLDPRANARKFRGPLFLMHGDDDWLLTPLATLELAAARPANTRTWILAETGHSPESLQLDEWAYRDQLAGFFQDAFAAEDGELDEPRVRFEMLATSEPDTTAAATDDARDDGSSKARVRFVVDSSVAGPVQVTLAARGERAKVVFHHERRFVEAGETTFECQTPFVPEHAAVTRARRVRDRGDGTWEPELSPLSQSLADFFDVEAAVKRADSKLVLRGEAAGTPAGSFHYERPLLSEATWREAKRRLPEAADVHPRVRPRYAELLAEIADGLALLDAAGEAVSPLEPAVAMLPFLPPDPASFVTLGNALIQVGFVSQAVERTLLRLWHHRVERGDLEGARAAWRELVKYVPQADAATAASELPTPAR